MKALWTSPDPTYTSVNLSIYASTEVFVGAFTACLPPLRKTIDNLLRKILPEGLISSRSAGDSYAMDSTHKRFSKRFSKMVGQSKPRTKNDTDSEHQIFDGSQIRRQGSEDEIIKTTLVSVTVNDKNASVHRNDDWA